MTARKRFTAAEIIEARRVIGMLSIDELLERGFINVPAALGESDILEVVLVHPNEKVIHTIKQVRVVTCCTLAEAKALVDNVPSVIARNLGAASARDVATVIRESGSRVTVRRQSR